VSVTLATAVPIPIRLALGSRRSWRAEFGHEWILLGRISRRQRDNNGEDETTNMESGITYMMEKISCFDCLLEETPEFFKIYIKIV
jgi:hypothetical protein